MRSRRTRLASRMALAAALALHALLLWALLRPGPRPPAIAPAPATMNLALVGPPLARPDPAPPTAAPASPAAASPQPDPEPPPPTPETAPPLQPPSPTPAAPAPPGRLPPVAPPPPGPPPVDPTAEPQSLHPTAAVAATSAQAAARDCGFGRTLQQALQADPAVLAAASALPPQALTPSRAVLLWDAGWKPVQDGRGGAGIAPIRRAIVGLAGAASAECRAEEVRGPRFLYLPAAAGTVVIVLGSGVWRWSDLATTDDVLTSGPANIR